MSFEESFKKIQAALNKTEYISDDKKHLAIQVRLTDDDSGGTFYIERNNGAVKAEPYNYYDNDVDVMADFKNFFDIVRGKTAIEDALKSGSVQASGNVEEMICLFKSVKQKTPRRKVKKEKTEETVMDKKEKSETITDVVEKETKPKKKKTTKQK